MAYVDKAKKAKIAEALKDVVPQGWKYSLAVRHHSGIVMTIYEAPFELVKIHKRSDYFDPETATNIESLRRSYKSENEYVNDVFKRIFLALNTDNHDNSDSSTDYFDVGHYVHLNIGTYDRPFVCTESPADEDDDVPEVQRPRG